MASLVLGVAGAAIGGLFGAPQIGWLIGSSIGSWLTAPDQYGPRSGEIKVQGSSYGTPLPIPYGVPPRFAGQIIWTDDIKRLEHSQSAGKGGPQVITETLSRSYAIGICEGPIAAITRIWRNGKLIYNVGVGASAGTLANLPTYIKLYLGTATQLSDPTIEAVEGVGNVSAYRGTVYAVLTNDDVTQTGGTNQYQFETATAGSIPDVLTWNSVQQIEYPQGFTGFQLGNWMQATCADKEGLHVFAPHITPWAGVHATGIPIDYLAHWVIPPSGTPYRKRRLSAFLTLPPFSGTATVANTAVYPSLPFVRSDIPGTFYAIYNTDEARFYLTWVSASSAFWSSSSVKYILPNSRFTLAAARLKDQCFYLLGKPEVSSNISLHIFLNGIELPYPSGIIGTQLSSSTNKIYVSKNFFWLLIPQYDAPQHKYLFKYDTSGNLVDHYDLNSAGISHKFDVFDDDTIIALKPSTPDFYKFTLSTSTWASTIYLTGYANAHGADLSLQDGYASPGYQVGIFNISDYVAVSWSSFYYGVDPPPIKHGAAHFWTRNFASTGVPLSTVQADICTRCGLTSGLVDVTALASVNVNYAIMGRMSGRDASSPLLSAFFYDSGEWDGKLNFVLRGATPTETIPLDDLGAYEGGGTPIDQVTKTRNDHSLLPSQVDVVYYDPVNDNQAAMQTERRFTVSNDNPQTLSFSTITMTDDHAKQVAGVNLFNFWVQAAPIKFSTGPKWSKLTPTDVRNIESYGTVRITGKHEAANGIIEYQAAPEQPSIYSRVGLGSGGLQTGQTDVSYSGPTQLELLDIPILRDSDDDYGFYQAVAGHVSGWSGETTFKSIDQGTTYAEVVTATNATILGYTSTALPDWDGSNVLDTRSVVRVELNNPTDTLSSVTWTQLLQNQNPMLLGNEIVQPMTCTLVSTGVYDLSNFLRGRRGTEWACTGHTAGERFVVLDATLRRIGESPNEIGVDELFKAVTAGTLAVDADSQDFTNTGIGKKPYSPVLIGNYRETDGSRTIKWQRRGRIDNQWRNYANMPLGESTELYDLEIWDYTGTVLLRTYSGLTAKSKNYLLTDMGTDLGSSLSGFMVKVYQIGSVGRGYPAIALIDAAMNVVWTKNWDDTLTANQTLWGGSSPTQSAATGRLVIGSAASFDARVQFTDISAVADCAMECKFQIPVASFDVGFAYRTTYWGNANNSFAYIAMARSNAVLISKGSNSSSPSLVAIASQATTISTGVDHLLRVEVTGNKHKIFIDNVQILSTTDSTYASAGQIAARINNGTGSTNTGIIDDMKVYT